MAPLSPVDARDTVIVVVKRALHGPDDTATTPWPGNERPPIQVEADQSFPDWKSLPDALVDSDGHEVLRVNPTRVYGIGVLFPHMTEEEEEALDAAQARDDVNADEDTTPAASIPDPEPVPGEAEDTVQVPDGGNRPRSIAVSFHVPADLPAITVTVRGGRYRRLPIAIAGAPHELWRRTPVQITADHDPAVAISQTHTIEGLTLNIGVDSRPLNGAGNLVTVYVANMTESTGDIPSTCLFQAQISIDAAVVLPYPSAASPADDEATFDLLYRRYPVLAVGHGTDAVADDMDSGWKIHTEVMPAVTLPAVTPDVTGPDGAAYAVGMRDLAEMNDTAITAVERIIRDYRAWLDEQELTAATIPDPRLRAAADANLQACRDFADDIDAGWRMGRMSPDVERCLSWTSHVMNSQRTASTAPLRPTHVTKTKTGREETVDGVNPHRLPQTGQAKWRPFQIAFVLASLPATVDTRHPKRDHIDIIWMPTGGGQTEAYLGLAAFTMLWERSKRVASGGRIVPSVDVLMRYTLRLLTAQQVQRASALMCAMEVLRHSVPNLLGDKPFRIGAFLGQASTPNSRKDAVALWNTVDHGARADKVEKGFLLTRCPWCGAQMGVVDGTMAGYRKVPLANGDVRVNASCPASDCPFTYTGDPAKPGGLPVLEVDEDIYISPPAFVVGTIDKFAQLAWKGKSRTLFGLAVKDGRVIRRAAPPSLFIQDELHLIAGPLGSLDALYEVTLQRLCETMEGRRPRIVAATATTRNFHKQVTRLYGREHARLVPPPVLDVDDSFFARTDPAKPGKTFVAVCAPGFGSAVQSQLRTLAALLHAGGTLDVADAEADPWWTNLAFFSSRRSLGLQLSATQTGLENAAFALSVHSGLRVGRETEQGTRHARRSISQVKELTATSRDNVTELLAQLDVPKGKPGCIDLCFATSMIEVGVDVPRLGLMTVMGQPKSYSQYIQVTGRVGRTDSSPGVVVVVLSPHNVRDRSHYETFTSSHRRLYASVEPVSITPFTPQALERGLAGALTGVLRTTTELPDPAPLLGEHEIRTALTPWRDRAQTAADRHGQNALEEETTRLVRLARAAVAEQPFLEWDDHHPNATRPFLQALGDEVNGAVQARWRIPQSMRSVDAEAGVNIPRGIAPQPERAHGTITTDTGEDF